MSEAADDERCQVEECDGVRFGGLPACFAHLGDEARTEALARLQPGADVDLRHTELTNDLLRELLRAVRNEIGSANFEGATFPDEVELTDVSFAGRANFRTTHWGRAAFRDAVFSRSAAFDDAVFDGFAHFRGARFGEGHFWRCQFHDHASFESAVFEGTAAFAHTEFHREARFSSIQVGGPVESREMTFHQGADFTGALFEQAERFGPLRSPATVAFDQVVFSRPVTIDADVDQLSFIGARFADTAVLRLQGTRAWLDGAILQGLTAVVSADISQRDDSEGVPHTMPLHEREQSLGSGSVSSLRGVDAGKVVLSGVDLSQCRFRGAYNLDKLRIEGRCR
ncbi:MAG TPA: hypothetical protein VK611_09825, partial [Acidimicrobiales bacterium]|nr:hypothetical protein [Acidimicrobiales bacterium]